VHRKNILCPTRCNVTQFILSGNYSTCFGWYHRPSSGAQTTVFTASGICHTVTTTCRYRGGVGTGFSVLWVAYAILEYPLNFLFPLRISGCPRHLPSGDQTIIRLDHLLRVHTILTYCFPFFPKLFVLPAFFLWWLHLLLLIVWRSLQLFSESQFLYFTIFSLTLTLLMWRI
jgi:hypothetical protein